MSREDHSACHGMYTRPDRGWRRCSPFLGCQPTAGLCCRRRDPAGRELSLWAGVKMKVQGRGQPGGEWGEISTGLGGLEGQAGVGADSKPLNAPSQPYEARPLCLFTRGTTLGPRKGHICSLKQKQTRSPSPRVQGPRAGIERGSGHGSCSERAVIPSPRPSVVHGGEGLPFCLTDADTEPQRGAKT